MRKVGQLRGAALRVMAGALAPRALCGVVVAGVGLALSAAPAVASDAKPSNTEEFAKAAAPLLKTLSGVQPLIAKYQAAPADARPPIQNAMKAALDAAGARAQLTAAESGIKNAADRDTAGHWGIMLGTIYGDMVLYQHGLQNVVDAGLGAPADRQANQAKLGILAFQNKDYAAAVKVLSPLLTANVGDDNVAVATAAAYANLGQNDAALAALKTAADARKAAGGVVPERWLIEGNSIAYSAKLTTQGIEWSLRLAANNPTPENLLIAESFIRLYESYDNPEILDGVRLAWRSGAMATNAKLSVAAYADFLGSAEEYKEFLGAADPRRYPGEVLAVIDAGVANGALNAASTSVSEPRATASKAVAVDRAGLAAFYRDAKAPQATGKTVVAAGDAMLSYGENAKAAELYQLALAKPGVDTNVVLNRLGMAQVGTGDYAGAQATLAKVQGKRQPLAALWSIYAQAKAAGK